MGKNPPVVIKLNSRPPIKSFRKAIKETGRGRPYLEKQIESGKLNYGYLGRDGDVDDPGVKVVIDDKLYREFLKRCLTITAEVKHGLRKVTGRRYE